MNGSHKRNFSHLGGHCNITHIDKTTLNFLKNKFSIKSMIDIGCGPGGQVEYATSIGIRSLGIDGDPNLKIYEDKKYIKHDFTKGSIDIEHFDLAWSVEFVEHVEKIYILNFMNVFKECNFACITHALPGEGGKHHVNCQASEYWIDIFHGHGFYFEEKITKQIRELSKMKFMKKTGLFFKKRNA